MCLCKDAKAINISLNTSVSKISDSPLLTGYKCHIIDGEIPEAQELISGTAHLNKNQSAEI